MLGTDHRDGRNFTELGKLQANRFRGPFRIASDEATSVSIGGQAACALNVNREVMCWGSNRAGQLGSDIEVGRADAQLVAGIGPVIELATSWS